jgi:hypothetical protein
VLRGALHLERAMNLVMFFSIVLLGAAILLLAAGVEKLYRSVAADCLRLADEASGPRARMREADRCAGRRAVRRARRAG